MADLAAAPRHAVAASSRLGHATVVIAGLAAFASFLWWQQDDFYINLQYARNLVERGEWAFNAGHPAYGTTSPLWILVLAPFGLAGVDLAAAAKAMSLLFAVVSLVLVLRCRDLFVHGALAWGCAISFLANHWFRLAVATAMEATLAASLVMWLGTWTLRRRAPTTGPVVVAGLLSGLLALTRPEFIVAIPLLAATVSMRARRRVAFVVAALAVLAPWMWFAFATFGSVVPNTVVIKALTVKAWGDVAAADVVWSALRIGAFFVSTNLVELVGAIALLVTAALRVGRPTGEAGDAERVRAPLWLLLAIVPGIYFINDVRGGVELSYRYAAPMLPALAVAGWLGLDRMVSRVRSGRMRRVALGLALTVAVGSNVLMSFLHLPFLERSHHYVDTVMAGQARWLAANSAPDDVVAAYDVGAVAYHSRRHVLDLVGLNSPEVIPFRVTHRDDPLSRAAILAHRPRYVITMLGAPPGAYGAFLPAHEAVRRAAVSSYRFEPSAIGRPAARHEVSLLRIDWPAPTRIGIAP